MPPVDRAIFYGVLHKGWAFLSGPISLLLISHFFTPSVQGYYYTFSSLLALQVFVELGLSQVLVQFVSHEWSHLEMDSRGNLRGDGVALGRFHSIARFTFRWYGIASLLFALGLSLGGFFYFSRAHPSVVDWKTPWLVLSLSSGLLLSVVPLNAIVEGCNQVKFLNIFRFYQAVFLSFLTWLAICAGANLWTLVLMTSVNAFTTLAVLGWHYRALLAGLFDSPGADGFSWGDEIWPMQWRIALSWLSGYFSFTLFTPTVFATEGAAMAGRMGMTWNILNVVMAVAATWVVTKIPSYGMLIARKDYEALDRLFYRSAARSIALVLLGLVAVWAVTYLLNAGSYAIANRLLPPGPTALFCIGTFFAYFTSPFSAYLRAHKREPYLWTSLGQGILSAVSTVLLGRRYGLTGIAVGFIIIMFLKTPIELGIWRWCRASWHAL